MVKQIRLTEEGLKQLIRESVRQSMNEAGWRDKFNKWGRKMQNKTANWFNGKKYDDEYSNHSSNNLTPDEQQEYDRDQEELRNTTPYPYSLQPHSVNMDDWNEAHSEEGNGNSDEDSPIMWLDDKNKINQADDSGSDIVYNSNDDDESNVQPAQAQDDNEGEQQQQTQPQPTAQPQYKRGAKYNVAFSRENEDMFNDHIAPTYNNLNNVIKSLSGLRQIGEFNYNQASSIFNMYGINNNYNGGQQEFKQVCQQIDSIMPTLQNLKAEMKKVLKANGIRDTEDYQHYNMEEQAVRKIISNSLKRILRESKRK